MRHTFKNIGMMLLTVLWTNPMFAQSGPAHWTCDDHAYEYEMAVYFSLIIDGEKVSDYNGYEVAAFCETECRGVSDIVSVADANVGYIRIRSSQTSGETISFKAYNKGDQSEWTIQETVSFNVEDLLGMPSSPMEMHIYTQPVNPPSSPVTISVQNVERVYGEPNPEFSFTSEGEELSGTPLLSCEADEKSPVGTYPIVVAMGSVTNGNVTLVNGVLTVKPAPLTIGVGECSRVQGEDNPQFTFTYEGFKNGEDESVLSTPPTASCEATKDSEPGEYVINVSGASADNYDITYTSGKLIVKAKEPEQTLVTITAQNVERVYGEPNPEFSFTSEGEELSGTPLLSCEADEKSPVGTYPIVVAMGSVTNGNVTLVNGVLTVKPAPLTIGVGECSRVQGEDNPQFTFTYEGFKNGEDESVLSTPPTASCEATKDSEPGEYVINVSGASADNYDITYRFGKLIVKEKSTPLQPEQTFEDKEGGTTVKGYITNDKDGNKSVVITELSEDMLSGNSPIPTEIVGEDGTVYPVHEIAAEAFENLQEGTIIILPADVYTDEPVANVINGDGTCKELNLTNVEKFDVPKQLIIDKVIYLRDIPLGTSTVCLPYDMDVPSSEVSFYTLASGIDGNAVFEKYSEAKLKAYMPYVMKTGNALTRGTRAKDDSTIQIDFSSKNVVINPNTEDQFVEKDELKMFGTVHGLTNKEGIEKHALILHDDGIWRMSASQTTGDSDKLYLPAFNAYMVVKKGILDENQNIESNFSDLTAIKSIVFSEDEVWYSIQGIKLNGKPTKPGLYIRNGEKVIL